MTATIAPAVPTTDSERFVAAWEEFFRTVQRAKGRANQAQGEGLSLSQFLALQPLAEGAQSVRTLAEAAGIAAPTATRMLDGLERDGLVTRTPDELDRRCVRVSLTASGRRALAHKQGEVDAARARIAASLEPEERAQAAMLLGRLAEAIEAEL
ncbi:MAG TPA: MarR family transcriptional regulator [Thermoleophilaceae bacterium]